MANANTMKLIILGVAILFLLAGSAHGADCYADSKPPQLSSSNYYSAADYFCGADISSRGKTYHFGYDGDKRKDISFSFSGNSKAKYCKTALNNIISQCVEATCGRNFCGTSGGRWDWSFGGEEAHFTIRGAVA